MKRSLQTAVMFAAFGLMLSGATGAAAQMMVGNYREAAKDDTQIVSAANFAVEARNKTQKKGASLKFVAVERAEKQLVAGTNYRLCLTVKAGGANQKATAVVFQNLKNKYELTSWTRGNCAATTQLLAPETVVKNLYAAQAGDAGPFFQAKDRAAVDRYFTKDFADLIWNDVFGADGVGNLDFDPLYNAQDTKITLFKIGKPEYGEGNSELADVPVTFKNMGKSETILFRLERNAGKIWKISDIFYPSNSEATASLKGLLAR